MTTRPTTTPRALLDSAISSPRRRATSSPKHTVFLALLANEQVPKPTLEYRFARSIGRQWRFDLAWPDAKIACEVEGGIWTAGRHVRGKGYEADCMKYSYAAILGWRVLRVTYGMIERGAAVALVKQAVAAETPTQPKPTAMPNGSRRKGAACA